MEAISSAIVGKKTMNHFRRKQKSTRHRHKKREKSQIVMWLVPLRALIFLRAETPRGTRPVRFRPTPHFPAGGPTRTNRGYRSSYCPDMNNLSENISRIYNCMNRIRPTEIRTRGRSLPETYDEYDRSLSHPSACSFLGGINFM